MHLERLGLFCGAVLCGTTAAAIANITREQNNIVPGAYIVELNDDYDPNSFMRTAQSSGGVALRRTLDYKLFKGVSIQLENGTAGNDLDVAISQIASQENVKRVWPVRWNPLPNDTVIWKGGEGPLSGIGNNAWEKRQLGSNGSDAFAPHQATQVDLLHAEGVTGKGIKIAVIDTGIDWKHPALGGCFGDGCLVSYGENLAGSDSEPLDCNGHGTHVAGIIAAQKNDHGFLGAAPDATLGSYRIAGCDGRVADDDFIAAFNKAFEAGSDIITTSMSMLGGFSENPISVVVQRIVEAGVPCTVAAGNSGASGLFRAESPAVGKGAAAIASTENVEILDTLLEGFYATDNSSSRASFFWREGFFADEHNLNNFSLPLWATPYNNSAEECEFLPSDTPDLSDRVVLLRAGSLCGNVEFGKALQDAVSHGARHILAYVGIGGTVPSFWTELDFEFLGFIQYSQGLKWAEALAKGTNISVDITEPGTANEVIRATPNPRAGYMSTFSSWGPGLDMKSYPHFAAPGSYILSTYPLDQGGYAILSGTSMSTPLAAAIFALVGQARGTFDPKTIKNVIASTAKANVFWASAQASPFLAPTAQQGAGLIQAYDAAHAPTVLSVSELGFNDTDHFVANTTFTISNTGSAEKTYSLSNVRAGTAYFQDENKMLHYFPPPMAEEGAELSFSSDKITIPAGGEAVVVVTPSPPAELDSERLPVYSGFISLNTTDGESLSLPYLGMLGSLYSLDPLSKDPGQMVHVQDGQLGIIKGNETFTFPKGEVNPVEYFYPITSAWTVLGTKEQRIDVISLDAAYNQKEVAGIKVVGSINHMPIRFAPGGSVVLVTFFNGQLDDESFVPAGGYKLLFSALRIFGDASKPEDWDFVVSPPFFINYVGEGQ